MASVATGSKGETLRLFYETYHALTKASEESLRRALKFGNVVNALHGLYTYAELAEEIDVTPTTVATYAKLYRKYDGNEKLLIETSRRMHTYDVHRLANDNEPVHYVYAWHCSNCGSDKVVKERVPDAEIPAQAETVSA